MKQKPIHQPGTGETASTLTASTCRDAAHRLITAGNALDAAHKALDPIAKRPHGAALQRELEQIARQVEDLKARCFNIRNEL